MPEVGGRLKFSSRVGAGRRDAILARTSLIGRRLLGASRTCAPEWAPLGANGRRHERVRRDIGRPAWPLLLGAAQFGAPGPKRGHARAGGAGRPDAARRLGGAPIGQAADRARSAGRAGSLATDCHGASARAAHLADRASLARREGPDAGARWGRLARARQTSGRTNKRVSNYIRASSLIGQLNCARSALECASARRKSPRTRPRHSSRPEGARLIGARGRRASVIFIVIACR